MKRLNYITLVLLFAMTPTIQAQEKPEFAVNTKTYSTAIGLRFGGTSGLTIKQFLGSQTALEGIFGLWHRGFSATLLYERYTPTGAPGLNWYYGAGGHVAFNTGHTFNYHGYERFDNYRDESVGFGIDGIVGVEYKIKPIPLALSFDIKPFFEINSAGGAWMSLDPGLGVKFTF